MDPESIIPGEPAVPVYENHAELSAQGCPPYIFHTPNPVPEVISPRNFGCHWHEGIELLGFVEGCATLTCDSVQYQLHAGQIAVINTNRLHMIESPAPGCRYHCLILEKDYCTERGADIEALEFDPRFSDPVIFGCLETICAETEQPQPFGAIRVEAEVLRLLAQLCRCHRTAVHAETAPGGRPIDLVKQTLLYLNRHYREPLGLDELAAAIGFSKYYLCRSFRAITGQTVIDYINARRCRSAQNLLARGACNVSECAELCGYSSLSYFTRQYRKIIGELPSQTRSVPAEGINPPI